MYDAHVFVTKYDNAEAKNTIFIIFAYGLDYFASALSYFLAKTCASHISRCVHIQAYLRHKQRTSIRKVSLCQKLYHCLIVLRRRTSATTNARVATLLRDLQINGLYFFRFTVFVMQDDSANSKISNIIRFLKIKIRS